MSPATPGPPEDALAAAGDVLARLWAARPAAERAAVAASIEAATTAPALDAATSRTLERLRGIAALSGGLSPGELVQGLASEVAEFVLDLLAPEFDRTWTTRDGWTWTLRTAARRQALGELSAHGTVDEALASADAVPTDAAGEALRGIAARAEGAPPAGGDLGSPAGLQALSWAEPLGGLAGDLAEARRVAILRDVGDGYRALLDHGVFGRDRELAKLRAFAEAPVEEDAPLPLLPLVGMGGTGKSTLLAAFVRPYLDRLVAGDPAAPAVVVLDFDRLAFRAHAQVELSFELTRQLGCAFPEAGADFSVLRHQTREEERAVRTQAAGPDRQVESDSLGSSGFGYALSSLVRLHGLERRPVLLVLDTVEEWQRERPFPWAGREPWNDPEVQLLAWTDMLRESCDLRGLRVVLAGRAEVAAAAQRARRPLRLGDLTRTASVALLRAGGVPAREAGPLATALGGNPLTLRVGLRFFLRLGPEERAAFLAGGGAGSGLDEDLRRALLYDRFLDHIGDDRVRGLAHPGLVLRRVTPDLVRHVLAPYTGLGEIDRATAEELTERLADEVWLVRRAPDGLRHQPDVRHAMLGMMSGDPEHAAAAAAIHRAAADWYASGRDAGIEPDAARVEWFYHSLMHDPPDPELVARLSRPAPDRDLVRWSLGLATAAEDLTMPARALVRVLRGDPLTPDEAGTLPAEVWDRWAEDSGHKLIAGDAADDAVALVERRIARGDAPEEPSWLAQAYSNCGRWDGYWRTAESTWPGGAPRTVLRQATDRYLLLAALLGEAPPPPQLWARILHGLRSDPDATYDTWLFADVLTTHGAPDGDWSELHRVFGEMREDTRRSYAREATYPVDQLRRLLVWLTIPGGDDRKPFMLRGLAGLVRPDPAWVARFSRLTGGERETAGYLGRLGELSELAAGVEPGDLGATELRDRPLELGGIDSHSLLNESSLSYARTRQDDVPVWYHSVRENAELLDVLRGDNPELRPAIRLALWEICKRRGGLRRLAEIATPLLPVPPVDLHPQVVAALSSSERRPALVRLVEYVDRSGAMRAFLDQAQAEFGTSRHLARVTAGFRVWDDTHNRMLENLSTLVRARG